MGFTKPYSDGAFVKVLKRVQHTGYRYYNHYRTEGGVVDVEISKNDYERRNIDEYPGGVWFSSSCEPKFNTADGKLGVGQYADVEGRYAVVNMDCFARDLGWVSIEPDGIEQDIMKKSKLDFLVGEQNATI